MRWAIQVASYSRWVYTPSLLYEQNGNTKQLQLDVHEKKEWEQKENESKNTLFSLVVGHMGYWTLGLWNCGNGCDPQLYISFFSLILLGYVVRFLSTIHHIVHLRFWILRGGYAGARHLGASKGNQNIIIRAQGAFRAVVETSSKLYTLQKGRLFITVLN